jgi:outer membrane protein assembly factor BamB
MLRTLPLLLLGLFAVPIVAQEPKETDWPAFRGAKRDNLSPDKGLLNAWPKDGPKVLWKATGLGVGYSTVSILGERLVTMGDLKDGCYVFSLDRKSGKEQWKTKIGIAGSGGGFAGPRSTPTLDGDRVYALGQFGELVALDAKGGKIAWKKNIKDDFGGEFGTWQYSESVLIDGEKLLCTPGGGKATVLALNKKNGEVIWQGVVPGGDSAGYASIVVARLGGVKQYVTLLANGLVGFSADKGELLWRYGDKGERFGRNTANIPTPIVNGEEIFSSAGYGRGAAVLNFTSSGGKFDVKEVYWNRQLNNKHGGVLRVGDRLFGDTDDRGEPWCADFATGKILWKREDRGDGSASMMHADGKLFVRYQNGRVVLLDAKADSYKELSSFKIPGASGDSWPHPVVIGGRLYLREKDTLYCHDVKGK